jgi:pentatricopeptide repeat protein
MRKRIGKAPLVAVLFFIGTLTPALGFFDVFPMQYSFVADHFQYLASIGIIALGVAGVYVLTATFGSRGRHVLYVICAAVLIILTIRTWNEGYKYYDRETLWRDTISKNPDSFMAHYNLGVILAGQGKYEEAISHYSELLRLRPDDAWGHTNLGLALAMQGKLEAAIRHYREALRIGPRYAYTCNNLGIALMQQGNPNEAIQYFAEALEMDPDYTEAHNNLGVALTMQNNLTGAIRHYFEALWFDPHYAKAYMNLESLLMNPANLNEAMNLSESYVMKEEYDKALFMYRKIGDLRPVLAKRTYYAIARMYARQNNVEEAVNWLKQAIERGFNDWDLLKNDHTLETIHNSLFYQELLEKY